jgi:pimeloyl-ACP methyl ester carboxylesterase
MEERIVPFARNGDVQIAYADWGRDRPEAEPMLLVAGLGGGRHAYPPGFVQTMRSAGFHVVSYDHRDVGASTRFTTAPAAANPFRGVLGAGAPAYTMEDMTDDAVAVMDALGWTRVNLVGQSMGGLVAQRIALRHPHQVRSLTSISALPSDTGRLASLRYLHLDFVRATSRLDFPDTREGDVSTALAVARICASPAYGFEEQATREWLEAAPVDGVRDSKAQARHLRATWHGPRLTALSVPTLVLHGDRDPVIRPAAARTLARRVGESDLVVVPGMGHDLPRPLWSDFARRVRHNAERALSADSRG